MKKDKQKRLKILRDSMSQKRFDSLDKKGISRILKAMKKCRDKEIESIRKTFKLTLR